MPNILSFAAQGLSVAVLASLVAMPLCILLARRIGVVDKPGGRKQHARTTPLLGGVGVFVATAVGLLAVQRWAAPPAGLDLKLPEIHLVLLASIVVFFVGLVDDIFKDRMAFQPKLLGQVAGVVVLMWPQLVRLFTEGGPLQDWLYQLFFLCWFLTIVNSFNFSDNMNGLMAGLSVVALASSLVYLGSQDRLRSMTMAILLVGSLLGFLPYNFPRARIFIGDAGSMFVGFWLAWIQLDMARGFFSGGETGVGWSYLVPAVLIMAVPLYDALFVVIMRFVEGRPVYLGDAHHLSHRLVRAGFTSAEAVVILWGLGIVFAGVGILAAFAEPLYRWLLFGSSLAVMIFVTRLIMAFERAARARNAEA